jgi:hypothetical protein
MNINLDEITQQKYYKVTHDLEYTEIDFIRPTTDSEVWFFIEIISGKRTSQSHSHIGFIYNFYSPAKNYLSELRINNWILSNIHEYTNEFEYGSFRIIDPPGCIVKRLMPGNIPGIIAAIKWLQEISHHPSFETLQLVKEYEQLKAEQEALLIEHTQLINMLSQQ